MKIVEKSISELKPYGKNPRRNEGAVPAVMDSIREYGFLVPMVIDSNGVVITGHTRMKAAERLGMDKVPCVVADDLSEAQIKAFRIADNKVSENALWDKDLLATEFTDLKDLGVDLSETGFSFAEIEELMSAVDEEVERAEKTIPEMELKSFESYDYVVFVFRDLQDWLNIEQEFGLEKVNTSFVEGKRKLGLGRVIDGQELLARLGLPSSDNEQGKK